MRKHILKPAIFSFLTFFFLPLTAQEPQPIPLYPDGVKSKNGIQEAESFDGHCVNNITDPAIYIFSPAKGQNTGAAVLICPGGGYSREAIVHEGFQVAEWLASEGITGIVLKYRLPNGHKNIPLEDVRQAMNLIRKNASELGINPNKVGISGFSAGGHLASTGGTHLTDKDRPDFMILFYPVISMNDQITHKGSRVNLLGPNYTQEDLDNYSNEKRITAATPPTLLLLSDDDKGVSPLNSTVFYEALKHNNVKSSMYIFPKGGHGWGYRKEFPYHETWKQLTLAWLKDTGILLPE